MIRRLLATALAAALLTGSTRAQSRPQDAGRAPNPYGVAGGDWRPEKGPMVKLRMPGAANDWDGCLAYRWGMLDPDNFSCMVNPCSRATKFDREPQCHWYDVEKDAIHDPDKTREWILEHPGKIYLMGNEPNNPDLQYGDAMTSEQYARMFHTYHTFIKDIDPTARLATGGLLATADKNWLNNNKDYWNKVLKHYREQFGEEMPVEIWNNHCYAFVGALDPDRIINTFFKPFREYVDTVAGGIYADREIWCTEFGVGMWSTPLAPDYLAEFMEQLCPRLEREYKLSTGESKRVVDRFFWFIGTWWKHEAFHYCCLLGPDGEPRAPGLMYSRLANLHPNRIPPPPREPRPPTFRMVSRFNQHTRPWRPIAGEWERDEGAYRYTSRELGVQGGAKSHLPFWYHDLEMECDLKINESDDPNHWAGVSLRHDTIWTGGMKCYQVYLRRNGELGLCISGNSKSEAAVPEAAQDTAAFHQLGIKLEGWHITVSLDGKALIEWDDPNKTREAGFVSLTAHKTDCSFDNVIVRRIGPRDAGREPDEK